jgi:1-acyl-sn-glycerol-3-phosphate acyltransferase
VRVAPAWVRRPPALLLIVTLAALALALLPLLLVGAALASALLPGRRRVLRLFAFALVYLLVECLGLLVALALWVASGFGWRLRSPAFQRAHYAVLRVVLTWVLAAARRLFGVETVTDGLGWSPLDDGIPGSTNAMVVLSRHAGPGDSLLLVRTLMDRDHLRRPRIVLKDALQLDPMLDVYLNRLPNAFLTPGRADLAARVGALARGMGEEDALLIFPEGGNFTPGRRLRVITKLRGKGMHDEAARAEELRHVLPPRTAGVAAALEAAPYADVVFVAHTGLEHLATAADIWHGLPMDTSVRMRWDFVPAAEVPREREEQADWLFERWAEIDRWIARHAASNA